ncbi:hypothetical protein F5Y08DRAFT_338384 [Xylaria arbuscula]|nr:hypothetical protein F5Y08DRAFT_338384 [Xylaria arbuscula]
MAAPIEQQDPWYLRSSVPVLFPTHDGLDLSISQYAFDSLVRDIVRPREAASEKDVRESEEELEEVPVGDESDSITLVSAPTTTQEIHGTQTELPLRPATWAQVAAQDMPEGSHHPFIFGLLSHENTPVPAAPEDLENKMLTENGDVAYRSTTSPLVDLFAELEDVVSGPRLLELLNAAWAEDPLATLKIIFNARSIHLGKASRETFYRCAGWLAQYHPLTLIANLRWLSRPVIQKKVDKDDNADLDMVVIDVNRAKDRDDVTRFDVQYGVSHGYWKDMLNILVLGVEGSLDVLAQPHDILYVAKPAKSNKSVDKEEAKARRHQTRDERHDKAVEAFRSNAVYRGLYLTVARLFAEQLKTDLALLRGDDHKAMKSISLCAKWAPSHDRFHDKHTFIVSSISELLHPLAEFGLSPDGADRETYLRRAREEYRKDMSALRAHLDIVERNLSAKTYGKIKYDRVPSLAMNNYSEIFAERDAERFVKYIEDVAAGKTRISGATLLPSTLIKQVRDHHGFSGSLMMRDINEGQAASFMARAKAKVADMQWKTLVQRIKDSGTLESSIAICDVSGSMCNPTFRDGTCPMDSALGLSLLLAEVTAPPFGGHFITFSETPKVQSMDLSGSLCDKINRLQSSAWGMSTNFVAVFEKLILPMAVRNKLTQEQMVKRVFVFSDMQFNKAQKSDNTYHSSFERIKQSYADAGYEMPELIFWNLAGGRAGYPRGNTGGDPIAPKPVVSHEAGTSIVSGYSQAMLKVFLDNGTFEEPEEEEVEEEVKARDEGDAVVVDSQSKKRKLDPMTTVNKAIGHKAYDPLVVLD